MHLVSFFERHLHAAGKVTLVSHECHYRILDVGVCAELFKPFAGTVKTCAESRVIHDDSGLGILKVHTS